MDTMVTSEAYLDAEVYQLWLNGHPGKLKICLCVSFALSLAIVAEEIAVHSTLVDQLDDGPDSKQILSSYAGILSLAACE